MNRFLPLLFAHGLQIDRMARASHLNNYIQLCNLRHMFVLVCISYGRVEFVTCSRWMRQYSHAYVGNNNWVMTHDRHTTATNSFIKAEYLGARFLSVSSSFLSSPPPLPTTLCFSHSCPSGNMFSFVMRAFEQCFQIICTPYMTLISALQTMLAIKAIK